MSHQHTQLTREERYHIWQMKRMGKSSRAIGQQMNRSHTTISLLLKPIRIKSALRGLSGAKPGFLLRNQIPYSRPQLEHHSTRLYARQYHCPLPGASP